MIWLGWRNLVLNRARLAVALAGVTVAVVLMFVQSGIYQGYMNSVSALIDHCPADLWIASERTVNADTARPIPEEEVQRVKAVPGIAWAEKMTHGWAYVTLPDGAGIWAQVIGFNPESGIGGPWEVVHGMTRDLKKPGTYFVDEGSLPLMRGAGMGSRLENLGQKMEIVGICRGARSYNTYPVMFTSTLTAQEQSTLLADRLNFVVAKLAPDAAHATVVERLRSLRHYEVLTRAEFSTRVRRYWATKTGIGVGLGITAALGFLVGLLVVGQTMYASTIEKIREYATLKALGATKMQICLVLLTPALLVGLAGYAAGTSLAVGLSSRLADTVVAVDLSPALFGAVLAATLVLCAGASLLSLRHALEVDPALGFRS